MGVTLARAVALQLDHLLEVPAEAPAWWSAVPSRYLAVDDAGNDVPW